MNITNEIVNEYYKDLCQKWNYNSTEKISTGYESVIPRLKELGKETWTQADDGGKQKIEKEVFDIYRSINLVPIYYYNLEGCVSELKSIRSAHKKISNRVLPVGNSAGLSFGRFWFENMQDAYTRKDKEVSLRSRFFNDRKLERAINLCYKHRDEGENAVIPKNLRRAFDLVSGGSIQNFKPVNAKAVWEYICPTLWGRVLDFSSGYGGRMLGAMTSNMRYHYTGIDPNTQTFKGLQAQGELLCDQNIGSGYELHCIPSEKYDVEKNSFDSAFSSPPYFNLETYCDEETQCMNSCRNIEDWFELYVYPTLKMIGKGLKTNCLYAVNIADYKIDKENYKIVDQWRNLSEKVGFRFEHTVKMMLNVRPGQGNNRKETPLKYEGIYIFSKKSQ